MKKIIPCIFIIFILNACATILVKNKGTFGKIFFKNLKNKSKNINNAYISGMFKINGVEDIPSTYLKFETYCFFNEKKVFFRIYFINTVITDIIINNTDAILVNHIDKEYVEYNLEQVDFSKFTGANFNPLDLSYFFLGSIPYSENMELIDFKWDKKEYIMDITDNISKYILYLNKDEKITKVQIYNQYFDNLILDSITYKEKSKDKEKIPYKFDFSTENKKIKISFVLKDILFEPSKDDLTKFKIPNDYKKVSSIDKIKLDFKKIR